MRPPMLLVTMVLLFGAGCATTPVITPREYLDEETAATITVVADPWIFTRENAPAQLDYLHLYAVDVNRQGNHTKYLALLQYWPTPETLQAAPKLQLRVPDRELTLQALDANPRQSGIAQPFDKSAPSSAKTWLYPLDKASLDTIARNRQLSVVLLTPQASASYVVWRDGSAQLSEFAATVNH